MFVKPKIKNIEFDNQIASQNDSISSDSKLEEENITSSESFQQNVKNVEFDNPITYQSNYIANDTKLKKKKNAIPPESSQQTVKVDISTPKRSDDLIFFSMKNPFKWLVHQFKTFFKKQNIVLQIPPFIAIPVLIALFGGSATGFFNLGVFMEKLQISNLPIPTPKIITKPTPTPKLLIISKLGYIKATYQPIVMLPTKSIVLSESDTTLPIATNTASTTPTSIPTNTPSPIPSPTPTISPTPTPPLSRYVLVDKSDKITFLNLPINFNFNYYAGKRVLITGVHDSDQNILKVGKLTDIEITP